MDDPWRADITQQMQIVNGDLQIMKRQHTELRDAVNANTAITNDIKRNTDDIVDFFTAAKGFFKVAGMVGTGAKWLTGILAAIGAIIAALHWGGK